MTAITWKRAALCVAAALVLAAEAPAQRPKKDNPNDKKPAVPVPDTQPASQPAISVVNDTLAEEEAKKVGESLGREMFYYETEHFTWCASLPESRMRPIAEGAEAVYRLFAEITGVKSWRELYEKQRCMGVLLPSKREYEQYVSFYAETYKTWNKEKFVASKTSVSYYFTPSSRPTLVTHVKPNDDDFLRQIMSHMAAHSLVNRFAYHNNFLPAWLEEAVSVWFEGEVCGKVACRCFSGTFYGKAEQADPKITAGLPLAKWKTKTKVDTQTTRAKNLTALWRLQLGELTLEDVEKGYAVVSWMMTDRPKFAEFMKIMKKNWPKDVNSEYSDAKGKAQEIAFKEAYGKSIDEVEAAVKLHVQKF